MDPIQILRNRLTEITASFRAIHEASGDRNLSPSQQLRWDALEKEQSEVRTELEDAEQRAAQAELVRQSRARWGSLSVAATSAPVYSATDVARMGTREVIDTAQRVLDQARSLESRQGDHVSALLRSSGRNSDNPHIARLVVLTESPEYRSAFMRAMTDPHPILTGAEAAALRAVQEYRASMSEGTPSAGGYGVPALIDPTIILTAQGAANPFFQIARVETITTNQWKGVSSDGVSWSFDAEATEVSNDAPDLAQPTVPVHTARGFVPFSIEVGEDYPSFSIEIGRLLAEGYGELTAEAFATGSGTGEPTGIFTALDANTNVEVVVTTDGAFGAVDVSKAWIALPDRAKPNATWLMSEDVKERVRTFGTDQHSTQTVTLTQAEFRIRERQVVASGFAPAFTASTGAANILVVGDFQKYLIAQRAGMTMEFVPHLFGTTNNRPTGERGYFAYARVGADSIDDKAFRLLQNQ